MTNIKDLIVKVSAITPVRTQDLSKVKNEGAIRAQLRELEHSGFTTAWTERLQQHRSNAGRLLLAFAHCQSEKPWADAVEIVSLHRGVGQKVGPSIDKKDEIRSKIEVIAAIVTQANGDCETVLRPHWRGESQPGQGRLDAKFSAAMITYSSALTHDDNQQFIPVTHDTNTVNIWDRIQNALAFREIDYRRESVPRAHRETFEWIFTEEAKQKLGENNFTGWLSSDQPCYWISGKAGSGKSTLMKFLWQHHKLRQGLVQWAKTPQNELLVASWFMWRAGRPLQSSQEGLLRALLYQVFQQRRDLMPLCFPSLFRDVTMETFNNGRLELTQEELLMAFSNLVKRLPDGTRLFLLIDGLDEYEGDLRELLKLCNLAMESKSIKLLVSSRPYSPCMAAFTGRPQLKLQELTHADIYKYVTDNLREHDLMKRMEESEEGKGVTAELGQTIESKAAGVFLWVVLAVRSLVIGLEEDDSPQDLRNRLRELPEELQELYAFLFKLISPAHQKQGSLMMQLLMRASVTQHEHEMTMLQMWFAETDAEAGGPSACLKRKIEPITPEEEQYRSDRMEGRLRSRCWGLLESQHFPLCPSLTELRVAFLHRTVIEFLSKDQYLSQIKGVNPKTDLELDEILLASSISELKCRARRAIDISRLELSNLSSYHSASDSKAARERSFLILNRSIFNIIHVLRYGWSFQTAGQSSGLRFIDQVRNVLDAYPELGGDKFEKAISETLHIEGFEMEERTFSNMFLLYAAVQGLGGYLTEYLTRVPEHPNVVRSVLTYLLMNLSRPPTGKYATSGERRELQVQQIQSSVLAILRTGIDPNIVAIEFEEDVRFANVSEFVRDGVQMNPDQDGLQPWLLWLSCARLGAVSGILKSHPEVYADIFSHMLYAHARLSGTVRISGKDQPTMALAQDAVKTMTQALPPNAEVLRRINKSLDGAKIEIARRETMAPKPAARSSTLKERIRRFTFNSP